MLKNAVLTDVENIPALIGREGRVNLGGDQAELISRRRASLMLQKRSGNGIFYRIRICRKFAALAISSFSTA